MKVYVTTDEDKRVTGYGDSPLGNASVEIEVEVDSPFLSDPMAYRLDAGELILDSAFVDKMQREQEERLNRPSVEEEVRGLKSLSSAMLGGEQADEIVAAQQLNRALAMFANTLPEEQALEIASVYPLWEPSRTYKAGEYVRHGLNQDGEPQVFRVVQAHTSQSDWMPSDSTASLFKKLGFTGNGTPVWVQPMGAHDAYQKDDIVSHVGELFVSTINGNVWAPGVHGWVKKN